MIRRENKGPYIWLRETSAVSLFFQCLVFLDQARALNIQIKSPKGERLRQPGRVYGKMASSQEGCRIKK